MFIGFTQFPMSTSRHNLKLLRETKLFLAKSKATIIFLLKNQKTSDKVDMAHITSGLIF